MRLQLPFAQRGVETLSAVFEEPEGGERRGGLLLACGAGSQLDSPFMAKTAAGLVARGFSVMRFHYAYRERALAEGKRMKPPDPAPALEAAHVVALEELRRRADDQRPLLAGKSLGGRISSHLAAKDHPCRGLVFLGYPLHPPRKPEKLRSEHFPAIAQPALFLQGTRDDLCDLDLLRRELATYGGVATVEVIEDANHSFEVRRSSGRTNAEVLEGMLDRIDRWERETFPS